MPHDPFASLPTLSSSPPTSPRGRRKSFARRLERCCCQTLAYFPLLFVYGLTTWGVWVEVNVSFFGIANWLSFVKAGLGISLWAFGNVSYTIAVFTSPGSPLDERRDLSRAGNRRRKDGGYEGLPTYEDEEGSDGREVGQRQMSTVTAKSDGTPRYCKKCRCPKPDRAHHCSTCQQCVLKMDHHCPWLATCVGLRNYKPFLLFLLYISIFCLLCFAVTASWVWAEIMDETQMSQGLMVVNTILLAVMGGIIGLVLGCFTGWHFYLAATGQTTIECLEKTRYLSPAARKGTEQQGGRNYLHDPDQADGNEEQTLTEHLKEIHANALPSILRPEEGVESSRTTTPPAPIQPSHNSSSPAQHSLRTSYAQLESQREHDRYAAYLDELDSEKLPNAFDLSWKRNLLHVFGDSPLLWGLPVCNTSGDGWAWEVSPKWVEASEEVARQRKVRERESQQWEGNVASQAPPRFEGPAGRGLRWTAGQGFVSRTPPPLSGPPPSQRFSPSRRPINTHSADATAAELQMQPLDRRKAASPTENNEDVNYDTSSSDEEVKRMYSHPQIYGERDWNDVPEDMLGARSGGGKGGPGRGRSRGRRKGD